MDNVFAGLAVFIVLQYISTGLGQPQQPLLHRVKRQFAAFGNEDSQAEDSSPGVVMSCDINEGDYIHEDALVLNLKFAEDSREIVRTLKEQQEVVKTKVEEMWQFIKESEKEQARLMRLQETLKNQNAQMVALISSISQDRFSPDFNKIGQALIDLGQNTNSPTGSPLPASTKSESQRNPENYDVNLSSGEKSSDSVDVRAKTPEIHDIILLDDPHLTRNASTNIPDEILSITVQPTARLTPRLDEFDVINQDPLASIAVEHENVHLPEVPPIQSPDVMCRQCETDQYCVVEDDVSNCYSCTECIKGYFIASQCNKFNDIVCQDVDECASFGHEVACAGKTVVCLNTPGGYLCLGGDGTCMSDYFFNRRSSQCEPCSICGSQDDVIVPCSKFSDIICTSERMEQQTDVWTGALKKPNRLIRKVAELNNGHSLKYQGTSPSQTIVEIWNTSMTSSKRSTTLAPPRGYESIENSLAGNENEDRLKLLRHGIVWMDTNFALRHSCRSYMQLTFLTYFEEPQEALTSSADDDAVLDYHSRRIGHRNNRREVLSGTRIEHSRGDRYKSVNLAAVAEVQPGQSIQVRLHSAHREGCRTSPTKSDSYVLRSIAPIHKSGPLSILWLSHDTGAIAYRASTKNDGGYSSLYATFTQDYASDLQVISLDYGGRFFKFGKPGIVLAKYHQSLYTIGEACIENGYTMTANVNRNSGETSEILTKSHKGGVSYTDTSMSLTVVTGVETGDLLSFDLLTPSRCQARYLSDLNLGVVNLLWVPFHSAANLQARLDASDVISGSVKSKTLRFTEVANTNSQRVNLRSDSFVEFKEPGRTYLHFVSKIIHSCDYLKATIHYVGTGSTSPKPAAIFQQVIGDTSGRWDGFSFGGAHTVEADSMCYVTITCVRGRINEMGYGDWGKLSVLWFPL